MAIIKAVMSVLTAIWFWLSMAPGIQIPQNGGVFSVSPPVLIEEGEEPELLGAASALSRVSLTSFGSAAADRITACEGRNNIFAVCGNADSATGDFSGAGARYPYGFIALYDNAGNLLKRTFVTNASLAVELTDICLLRNGNAVVCGNTCATGNNLQKMTAFVSEYDSELNLLCTKEIEGTNNVEFKSVSATSNGFVAGGKTASVDGDFEGTAYYGSDGAFMIRYKVETDSSTGAHSFAKQWQKNIFSDGVCSIEDISADTSNNIYVSLSTGGTMGDCLVFDGLVDGSLDNVIIRYSGGGVMQWYTVLASKGRDNFCSVYADPQGGCVAGGYSVNLGLEPGNRLGGTLSSLSYMGSVSSFVFRLSAGGEILWSKSVSGTGEDFLTSVVKCGNNYVAGGYSNSYNGAFAVNNGGTDGFASVLSSDGRQIQMLNFGGSENDRVTAVANTNGVLTAAGYSVSQDGVFEGLNPYAYVNDSGIVSQDVSDCFISVWN